MLASLEASARHVAGVEAVRDGGLSRDGSAAEATIVVSSETSNDIDKSRVIVDEVRADCSTTGASPGLTLHRTGPLAVSVDSAATTNAGAITRLSLLLVIVLLFAVYRAVLAPLVTLIPAALSVIISGPLIAELSKAGVAVAPVAQQLLIVLLVGAGADYGLFLTFRLREELAAGADVRTGLATAVGRVGEAVTYSALTVGAALLTLLIAPFGIYRGLGPALALGIAVLLIASLTLTPALLAIFGRSVFWPRMPRPGPPRRLLWGSVAQAAARRPIVTLVAGLVLFGGLASGLTGYRTAGLSGSAPSNSDSAAGSAVLAAHFAAATSAADQVLLRFEQPVGRDRAKLDQVRSDLAALGVFKSVTGPLVSPDGRTVE